MAGGYRDIFALQGVTPLQAAAPTPPAAAGFRGLLELQGIWPTVPGAVVNKVQEKDCNWGSWCKRYTRIVP